jgi:hypothetical protein
MAIIQVMTSSFKAQALLSVHDFRPSAQSGASIFKIALYTSLASLDANTTAYTATGEVVGTGYTAGGIALTNLGVTTSSLTTTTGVGWVDFSDPTWAGTTITARGALIYNSTPKAYDNAGAALTNPSVAVLDFGSDKVALGGNFTITLPAPVYNTAILQFA